jgi:hypothetical protein
MYSEETLQYLAIPMVSCPFCSSASSNMIEKIQQAGIWGKVTCQSCKEFFEVATAIDEGFVKTNLSGYTLWTGGKQICRPFSIKSGTTVLIDIKGIFEEVYIISPHFESFESLAGGFDTKYIPQGYAMLALAPNPGGEVHTLNGISFIEGRTPGQKELSNWKKMLLMAKLSIYKSPYLTVIMSLNAVDLYLEELTNLEVGKGRPGSWCHLTKKHFGIKLKKLLGQNYTNIESFVDLRNALAHGREHVNKLPNYIVDLEKEWLKNGKYREGIGAYAPSASFALSSSLEIIRGCRRIVDNGAYYPVYT